MDNFQKRHVKFFLSLPFPPPLSDFICDFGHVW